MFNKLLYKICDLIFEKYFDFLKMDKNKCPNLKYLNTLWKNIIMRP